jgi:hypothetical protein
MSRRRARRTLVQSPTLQDQCPLDNTSLHRTAPRKVSEEDINACTDLTCRLEVEVPPLRRSAQLKRPSPSVCLVDLAPAIPGKEDTPTTNQRNAYFRSPVSSSFTDSEQSDEISPSSPWGHFIDLLAPSISSDDDDAELGRASPKSFLPSVCGTDQPYGLSPKRRRLCSSARTSFFETKNKQASGQRSCEAIAGFLLASPSTCSMLDAAQDALQGLRF